MFSFFGNGGNGPRFGGPAFNTGMQRPGFPRTGGIGAAFDNGLGHAPGGMQNLPYFPGGQGMAPPAPPMGGPQSLPAYSGGGQMGGGNFLPSSGAGGAQGMPFPGGLSGQAMGHYPGSGGVGAPISPGGSGPQNLPYFGGRSPFRFG